MTGGKRRGTGHMEGRIAITDDFDNVSRRGSRRGSGPNDFIGIPNLDAHLFYQIKSRVVFNIKQKKYFDIT